MNSEQYDKLNDPDKVLCRNSKFCDRIYRFLCYDWFVCICIFIFVFEFIWACIGIGWKSGIEDTTCKDKCEG